MIRSVTINGPDHDEITAGLNQNSTMENLEVDFKVFNGTIAVGPGTIQVGDVQERIRRPQFNFDSGFVGGGPNFFFTLNTIRDLKSASLANPDFINATNEDPFDDFYQQNRMKIYDGFGVLQTFFFAERHFQRVKVNGNTWKLIQL